MDPVHNKKIMLNTCVISFKITIYWDLSVDFYHKKETKQNQKQGKIRHGSLRLFL